MARMTVNDAEAYLGVTRRTLYRYIEESCRTELKDGRAPTSPNPDQGGMFFSQVLYQAELPRHGG